MVGFDEFNSLFEISSEFLHFVLVDLPSVEISFKSLSGVMRLRVEGRLSVVSFLTTLPPLNVVTVTRGATGFLVEVLRVRVLRVFVGFAAGDLTGIKNEFRLYSLIVPIKKPLTGFL
tara:strand:- start:130 stop:480 length:351 start_codon:yes stop_codon:yes gene_type:complete